MEIGAVAESLVPDFKLEKVINQDWGGRRLSLLGEALSKPTLLIIERAAFPTEIETIRTFASLLTNVDNLGANDIYAWYLANVSHPDGGAYLAPDLKLSVIHPCTESHIKKYSPQSVRVVNETPEIFRQYVRPYMVKKQEEGRLNWVYNIIDGFQEQQDIILRESRELGRDEEGFLLLPDMNWDRKTMASLRILGLVERRDLLSLRDLKKKDVPWLKEVMSKMIAALVARYGSEGVEADMLKCYVHYQPTYYHFHIHVVSVNLEASATQAVGKAFSLPNLISQLETMAGGPDASLADVELTYTIGDKSELWERVFRPLKEGTSPSFGV